MVDVHNTVAGVVKYLQGLDQSAPVVISSDEEGNAFSLVAEITTEQMTPIEDSYSYDPDDYVGPGSVNCVVFWPSI